MSSELKLANSSTPLQNANRRQRATGRKRYGLKEFLIFSYVSPLVIILMYYTVPFWNEFLLGTMVFVSLLGLVVGTLGTTMTLVVSMSVWAFSPKSVDEIRKDQIVLMKMLGTFVAITVGPTIVTWFLIVVLGSIFG